MKNDFEVLSHTSDLKIRAYGNEKKELFKNMLVGMFASIHPTFIKEAAKTEHSFEVHASDIELLLVDFLSHALYLSDIHKEAYVDVAIDEMSDLHIVGRFVGRQIRYFEECEIKAVTYHDLKVEKTDDGYTATVLFDL